MHCKNSEKKIRIKTFKRIKRQKVHLEFENIFKDSNCMLYDNYSKIFVQHTKGITIFTHSLGYHINF